jgi:hypothetical protein
MEVCHNTRPLFLPVCQYSLRERALSNATSFLFVVDTVVPIKYCRQAADPSSRRDVTCSLGGIKRLYGVTPWDIHGLTMQRMSDPARHRRTAHA